VVVIEQDMQAQEQLRLQNKDKLDARMIEQGVPPQEQHVGHLWNGKHFNMIQPKIMTVILNFILGE
jgi:hypothetical protein